MRPIRPARSPKVCLISLPSASLLRDIFSGLRSEIKELDGMLMDATELHCRIWKDWLSYQHETNLPGIGADRREDAQDRLGPHLTSKTQKIRQAVSSSTSSKGSGLPLRPLKTNRITMTQFDTTRYKILEETAPHLKCCYFNILPTGIFRNVFNCVA